MLATFLAVFAESAGSGHELASGSRRAPSIESDEDNVVGMGPTSLRKIQGALLKRINLYKRFCVVLCNTG